MTMLSPLQRRRESLDGRLGRAAELAQIDFAPDIAQPSGRRLVLAAVTSVIGSLAADAIIVAVGTAVFPSTKGYTHFRLVDYARLTMIGVIIASAAWPVVTRISSAARRWFLVMAVAVTLVLLLPDAWIWTRGQPGTAVAVLVVMHFAIALVTFNALVRVAPASARGEMSVSRVQSRDESRVV